jgi:5-formyltetrahydrofolate cyclo-ligase
MPEKNALRKAVHEILRALPQAERPGKSRLICEAIARMPEWQASRAVCFFAPLPGEPDVGLLHPGGRRVCYPRVNGGALDLYFVDDPGAMEVSPWGIREPKPDAARAAKPCEIDLILVPGIAFSPGGGRLGRGAGFYDRLLARPGWHAKKIGVCFDCQLVDRLPVESHDHEVDCVVTESKITPAPACRTGESGQ